jgi:hypothetical protein
VRTTTARIATINIAKAEFGVASAVANVVVGVLANAVVEVLANPVEVLANVVVEVPVTVVPAVTVVTFCDPSMNS